MEQIYLNAKSKIIPLAKKDEAEVLNIVMVLLVTINNNEISATLNYLQPLDRHEYIYEFIKDTNKDGQQTKTIIYYIGKYGACPAAIRATSSDPEVHGNASTMSMVVDQCFPNLNAVIRVGVACGIKEKVKLFDVLVSSEVVDYNKTKFKQGEYLPIEKAITVSPKLLELFTHCIQWPDDALKKHFNDKGIQIPSVKSGVVLNGPYLVDDPRTLIENFVPKAIGIEIEGDHIFVATQHTMTNFIIVKAVCDFGDGKYSKTYQPTAAILAADLVHNRLSDPQAPEFFKSLFN